MGACNTTQNEIGGKNLILKTCENVTGISTAGSGADITKSAHGLAVGDIVKFTNDGGSSALNTTDFYYVSSVPTSSTFQVSATKGGSAIAPANVSSGVEAIFFKTVAGIRSKSFSFKADGIDITNADSNEWSNLLDGAGIRSFSVSGSGVYTNQDTFQDLVADAMANRLVCLMFIDASIARLYEGCFKITSIDLSGDYDGEGQFSISAESSGEVVTALLSS